MHGRLLDFTRPPPTRATDETREINVRRTPPLDYTTETVSNVTSVTVPGPDVFTEEINGSSATKKKKKKKT